MKKSILAIVILVAVSGIFYFLKSNKTINWEADVIVVDTPESRTKGLSGREFLPEDSVMLFVFEKPDTYSIWMKDMKFPIDIIWLDESQKIVHIEENISPNTYPKTFFPPEKSLYIVEANAGFAIKNSLSVGKTLNIGKR